MDLLSEVKVNLRISSDVFDEAEVQTLIGACKADLKRVGVITEESNPLVKQAIIFYCKAFFGFANDTERYRQSYETLRNAMAISGDFCETEEHDG